MKNNKNSLDLLEEQLFDLLKEYQGFSDGAQYVGMNTKGPYEDRDVQWNKKVYGRDTKNIKVLIGSGSKKKKHVKTGGPYTNDPPKRRPVNKLSAPPGILNEDGGTALDPNFVKAFMAIEKAQISFKTLKKVSKKTVTIFAKGKTYRAEIQGNNISVFHEEFSPVEKLAAKAGGEDPENPSLMTKQKFLDTLSETGELCKTVDCAVSTITTNGKTQTFQQILDDLKKPKSGTPEQQASVGQQDKQAVGAAVGGGVRLCVRLALCGGLCGAAVHPRNGAFHGGAPTRVGRGCTHLHPVRGRVDRPQRATDGCRDRGVHRPGRPRCGHGRGDALLRSRALYRQPVAARPGLRRLLPEPVQPHPALAAGWRAHHRGALAAHLAAGGRWRRRGRSRLDGDPCGGGVEDQLAALRVAWDRLQWVSWERRYEHSWLQQILFVRDIEQHSQRSPFRHQCRTDSFNVRGEHNLWITVETDITAVWTIVTRGENIEKHR